MKMLLSKSDVCKAFFEDLFKKIDFCTGKKCIGFFAYISQ